MNNVVLRPGPVTLYAQLASILRDRVISGVWKSGEEVPTLEQLVEEFSVARVTVRQAVQMLVDEGLLSSQRGRRTFVTFEPPKLDMNPLYSSTGSINGGGSNYSITVLSKQEFDELPTILAASGNANGRFIRIRKVDSENGMPYAVSDNFISLSLYNRFPADAEVRAKLSRLVRDYARPPLAGGMERITVSSLSYDEATALQAPIGSPVARVTRTFFGPNNRIVYVGQFAYRADRFAIDRDISNLVVATPDVPPLAKLARPVANGRRARSARNP